MTPILRKSKEAAKSVVKSAKSNHRDARSMITSRFLRSRGRGRKLFLTSRSRLASLARGGHLHSERRGIRDHHRYHNWFGRGEFAK